MYYTLIIKVDFYSCLGGFAGYNSVKGSPSTFVREIAKVEGVFTSICLKFVYKVVILVNSVKIGQTERHIIVFRLIVSHCHFSHNRIGFAGINLKIDRSLIAGFVCCLYGITRRGTFIESPFFVSKSTIKSTTAFFSAVPIVKNASKLIELILGKVGFGAAS